MGLAVTSRAKYNKKPFMDCYKERVSYLSAPEMTTLRSDCSEEAA